MSDSAPTSPAAPDRQDAILDAAFHVFATYGFRRAAMEDIARAAGLSRTALYLHYRNKEDIFRQLSQRYFAQSVAEMRAALTRPGQDAETALLAAFHAKDGKFMEVVLGTPHGAELLDAGFSIASDLAKGGEAQMIAALADWFRAHPAAARLGPAEALADTVMAALKGLKLHASGLDGYRSGQVTLARLIGRAMSR